MRFSDVRDGALFAFLMLLAIAIVVAVVWGIGWVFATQPPWVSIPLAVLIICGGYGIVYAVKKDEDSRYYGEDI